MKSDILRVPFFSCRCRPPEVTLADCTDIFHAIPAHSWIQRRRTTPLAMMCVAIGKNKIKTKNNFKRFHYYFIIEIVSPHDVTL